MWHRHPLLPFPAGMPLAASCLAAIGAACHPPLEDVDASVKAVQWGSVSRGLSRFEQSILDPSASFPAEMQQIKADEMEAVGHCTFTSFPVEAPVI
jgi:hypothetical protein